MSEPSPEIKEAFAEVVELRDEQSAIIAFFTEEHPHEMRRLDEIKIEIPAKLTTLSDLSRIHNDSFEYLGHRIKVQKKSKTIVDAADILVRARERGDIDTLLELGFIEHSVNAKQLERLPGELRAVYGTFINKTDGTSAVTLPKELKG
jgi:hypothetical protein